MISGGGHEPPCLLYTLLSQNKNGIEQKLLKISLSTRIIFYLYKKNKKERAREREKKSMC